MNKSLLAIAVAATMAAPAAVMAAPTVYGNVHLTIEDRDSNTNLNMRSNTSSIGVKGSEDLGDGMKAIYKVEFQLNADGDGGGGDALTQRDVFVGIKGGMGTIKLGAMSSNYKQMGGKVDALYRTPVEGRGFLQTHSRLHNGRAVNRGRMTNGLQYSSPKMGGIQLVANTTFSDSDDETMGVGIRYATKNILAYVDWIDTAPGGAATATAGTESAIKVGAKYSSKAFFVAGQFESAEDVTGFDYMHLNGGFNIDKNNAIIATFGTASFVGGSAGDTTGLALAFNHKMSKMTNVYVAYGDRSSDTASLEDSIFTVGIKKKF